MGIASAHCVRGHIRNHIKRLYKAEVLVHEIVNVLAAAKIDAARESAERLLDDPWDRAFRETMGTLVRQAGAHLAGKDELIDDLAQALAWRNDLAHRFWRERSDDFMTDQGRSDMISYLCGVREHFERVDTELTEAVTKPLMARLRVTPELLSLNA